MICPECKGTVIGVINTHRYDDHVTRIRECKTCYHEFRTYEIPAPLYKLLMSIKRLSLKVQEVVKC